MQGEGDKWRTRGNTGTTVAADSLGGKMAVTFQVVCLLCYRFNGQKTSSKSASPVLLLLWSSHLVSKYLIQSVVKSGKACNI